MIYSCLWHILNIYLDFETAMKCWYDVDITILFHKYSKRKGVRVVFVHTHHLHIRALEDHC